jgi:hypothetical protein
MLLWRHLLPQGKRNSRFVTPAEIDRFQGPQMALASYRRVA